jgi:geranylgeranyl diphosphate synthase, type II
MKGSSDLVRQVLGEYGAIVRDALTEYLAAEGQRNPIYRLAGDYPMRKGRALRASFCIAAARAFGASIGEAVQSALSLELLHNAFLVHDDVEDESEERRGAPALHVLYDVPTAVNAGDALLVLGLRPLFENRRLLGPSIAWNILAETERMVRESVEGQALELTWRRDNALELTDSDYLGMTLKKTCWYTTIYPSRIGAIIGRRDSSGLDVFVRFGFFLGAAFQIQDDVLNLLGDHDSYGKEIAGDLLEGKRTLMLIHLLRSAPDIDIARVRRLLGCSRSQKDAAELRWLRAKLDEYDCIEYARRVAHALAGAAMHEFDIAYRDARPSRDKRFIESLPYWVLERS